MSHVHLVWGRAGRRAEFVEARVEVTKDHLKSYPILAAPWFPRCQVRGSPEPPGSELLSFEVHLDPSRLASLSSLRASDVSAEASSSFLFHLSCVGADFSGRRSGLRKTADARWFPGAAPERGREVCAQQDAAAGGSPAACKRRRAPCRLPPALPAPKNGSRAVPAARRLRGGRAKWSRNAPVET